MDCVVQLQFQVFGPLSVSYPSCLCLDCLCPAVFLSLCSCLLWVFLCMWPVSSFAGVCLLLFSVWLSSLHPSESRSLPCPTLLSFLCCPWCSCVTPSVPAAGSSGLGLSSTSISVFNIVVSDLADPGRDCRSVGLGSAWQCFRLAPALLDLSLGLAGNHTTTMHHHLDSRATRLSAPEPTFTFWRDKRSWLTTVSFVEFRSKNTLTAAQVTAIRCSDVSVQVGPVQPINACHVYDL